MNQHGLPEDVRKFAELLVPHTKVVADAVVGSANLAAKNVNNLVDLDKSLSAEFKLTGRMSIAATIVYVGMKLFAQVADNNNTESNELAAKTAAVTQSACGVLAEIFGCGGEVRLILDIGEIPDDLETKSKVAELDSMLQSLFERKTDGLDPSQN